MIDITLVTENFLLEMLPKGKERSDEEDEQAATFTGIIDHFDPKPYDIMAKRIYQELMTPSRAYFVLIKGLQRGIKQLDFAAIEAYEISKIFSQRRNQSMLETMNDLEEATNFTNSYDRFAKIMEDIYNLIDYSKTVIEIVGNSNDDRVYQHHYLQHLRAYLAENHDLNELSEVALLVLNQSIMIDNINEFDDRISPILLDRVDFTLGFKLIENELFTYNIRVWNNVKGIVDTLEEYVEYKKIDDLRDQIWVWRLFLSIAEKFTQYRSLKKKEFTFKQIEELIRMPNGDEKYRQVDDIVSLIVGDTTGALTLQLGKIIGNDTLMESVNDALEVQKLIEGEERQCNVVGLFADVVINQQNYDLPKIMHSKESKIYHDLEVELLARIRKEFQDTANEVGLALGSDNMKKVLKKHDKIINKLDPQSRDVKSYKLFLELMDIIKERFTGDDDITSKIDPRKCLDLYSNGGLMTEMFNQCSKLESFDELISELKNNVFSMLSYDQDHTILLSVLDSLLFRLGKEMSNKGDQKHIEKLAQNLTQYAKLYVEEHSDKFDEVINKILKIVGINLEDNPTFNIKKQDMLRQAIRFCQDEEIIETLANLHVDMLSSDEADDLVQLMTKYMEAEQDIDKTRIEQRFLCGLCNDENDLIAIQQCHEALEYDEKCMPGFKLLQKAMFVCKDRSIDSHQLKYYKTRKLTDLLKNQFVTVLDDMEKVSDGDTYYCLNYRINKSINEVQSIINEGKIKKKQSKISTTKKSKKSKLNERELKELEVLKQLLEATSQEEVDEIVSIELSTYDENLHEQSKKDLFLKKYGPKLSKSINFCYMLSAFSQKYDPILVEDVRDFLAFFPDFYLPIYFTLNKKLFSNNQVPKAYSDYLIKPYIQKREEYAIYNFLQEQLMGNILTDNMFLFYAELVGDISTNMSA